MFHHYLLRLFSQSPRKGYTSKTSGSKPANWLKSTIVNLLSLFYQPMSTTVTLFRTVSSLLSVPLGTVIEPTTDETIYCISRSGARVSKSFLLANPGFFQSYEVVVKPTTTDLTILRILPDAEGTTAEKLLAAIEDQKAIHFGDACFMYSIDSRKWVEKEFAAHLQSKLLTGFILPITTTVKSKKNRLAKLNEYFNLELTEAQILAAATCPCTASR